MRKNIFAKAISLTLAVSLIMSALVFGAAVNVSAETVNGYDIAAAAYLIDYQDAEAKNSYAICTDQYGLKEKVVSVSFSYYLKNASKNEIMVMNGTGEGGSFVDNATGSAYLLPGEHEFTFGTMSYQRDGMYVRLAVDESFAGVSNAKLYIWDVTVTADGNDYFLLNQNWCATDKVTATAIPYEEVLNAKDAYYVDMRGVADGKQFGISTDKYGLTDKAVTVSFDYYLKDTAANKLMVNNGAGGTKVPLQDASTGDNFLRLGENKYSFTTDAADGDGLYVALYVTGVATSSAELYIWNVQIIANGVDIFSENAPQYGNDGNGSCTKITYEDVVKAKAAYYIDFRGVSDDKQWGISNDTWSAAGTAISVSFKYYLKDVADGKLLTSNLASGGTFADATTGSGALKRGEHKFSFTSASYDKAGFLFAFYVTGTGEAKSSSELYIWDVKITVGGANFFTTTGYQSYTDATLISEITVADVEKAKYEGFSLDFSGKSHSSYYILANAYKANKNINISFDYYLEGAKEGNLYMWNAAAAIPQTDTATGSEFLIPGRHSYNYTLQNGTANDGNFATGIRVAENIILGDVKLYIWNLKMTADGVNFKNETGYQCGAANIPTYASVEYDSIAGKGDANNDGNVNVLDLIRMKRYALKGAVICYANANIDEGIGIDATDLVAIKKAILEK